MISVTVVLTLQQWPHAVCPLPRLEKLSASLRREMTLNIERVVGCRMKGEKSLSQSDGLETLHDAFSSGRLMQNLCPVVSLSSGTMRMLGSKITHDGVARSQSVRDRFFWGEAIFLHELAHQFLRSGIISLGLDQAIQNLSFAIDDTP